MWLICGIINFAKFTIFRTNMTQCCRDNDEHAVIIVMTLQRSFAFQELAVKLGDKNVLDFAKIRHSNSLDKRMRRGNAGRHGNFTWSYRLSWPTSAPQLPVLYESNTRVQATTRLLVIEPILTGVDVFAANGISAVMLHDDGNIELTIHHTRAALDLPFSMILSENCFHLSRG